MLTLLSVAALLLILLWIGQRRLLYFPFSGVPPPAAVGLPRAELVSITTVDGLRLNAWFVPATGSETRFAMVLFSWNAGQCALPAPLAAARAPHGIATLLMDYRGYGGNPGSPSEEGLALDARAARAYLTRRAGIDQMHIVYFGESLGTGVAVQLAAAEQPFALILRSPFTSLVDVARDHYPFLPVRWMLRDRFDSLGRIRGIGCPLLVIAGDRDGIISPAQSERRYAAAAEPKRLLIIAGADHNDDALLAGPRLIQGVIAFLNEVQQVKP
jgi:fermentation-respiration switch protein FrsA (DUF1100 family)